MDITSGEDIIPEHYSLSQNYPNPFNPTTKIYYSLPVTEFVSLMGYDILGREVANLVNKTQKPGSYLIEFDSDRLSSGAYFYQLKTSNHIETKKIMIMK